MSETTQPVQADGRRGPPRIPRAEYAERWARLGRALSEEGVDGWIAYADDHAVAGPDHVRYLCDLEPHFEPVLLVGRGDGPPAMLTGPETVAYAELVTAGVGLQRIVSIHELEYPDEEYPTIESVGGRELLAELLDGVEAVAVLGGGLMGRELHEALLAPLAQAGRLRAPDELAYALRVVRSEAEHAVIDEAYRIAAAGLQAAMDAIAPGTTERAVVAAAEAAMRAAGAEGFGIDTMCASGPRHTYPILARSTFRRIERDDLVTITVAPRYEGYHAAMARPFLLAPNAELERAARVAREAQEAAEALLVPGTPGRDAEAAARAHVEAAGTGAEVPYAGVHSIGCVEFEPPVFHSARDTAIERDMAISIDVPMFHAPWGGMRLEDGYRIAADGPQARIDGQAERWPLRLDR